MSGDFDGLTGHSEPTYDASAMREEEAVQILAMREAVGELPEFAVKEVAHDYFFLRFLRGYQHNVKQASKAYLDMLAYREESDVKAIHDELVREGMPWPWDMAVVKSRASWSTWLSWLSVRKSRKISWPAEIGSVVTMRAQGWREL